VVLDVADDGQAATAVAALQRFGDDCRRPRLDGELVFLDGNAYAWREWQAWRSGHQECILSKGIDGPRLIDPKNLVRANGQVMAL
jgi:phosphoribosyl-dephospho-CoA transferase